MVVVEKVLKCIMAIIDYKKSVLYMTLKIDIFDPLINKMIYAT